MAKRKQASAAVEANVLVKYARRCTLCYGLHHDLRLKKGQIAHVDQDPANSEEANLVYLCFEHHDEYDSTTKQSKGITEAEVREYARRLAEAIARGEHATGPVAPVSPNISELEIRAHDREIFRRADELMSESFLKLFLDDLGASHAYQSARLNRIYEFRELFANVGNLYLTEGINDQLLQLLLALDTLTNYLAQHFFVYPREQPNDSFQLCMYPDLNIDRGGSGTYAEMSRYADHTKRLVACIKDVKLEYEKYRTTVKRHLLV